MRALICANDINREIDTSPDRFIAHLLASHLKFMSEYDGDESLTVLLVERGDTLATVDAAMDHRFLVNAYSGKRYGEADFAPCFETLQEHQTFYEMFFIEGGGELGISVVIPRRPDIDPSLLAMCAQHAKAP